MLCMELKSKEEQEAKRFINLGFKTPLNKIPLLGDILLVYRNE